MPLSKFIRRKQVAGERLDLAIPRVLDLPLGELRQPGVIQSGVFADLPPGAAPGIECCLDLFDGRVHA